MSFLTRSRASATSDSQMIDAHEADVEVDPSKLSATEIDDEIVIDAEVDHAAEVRVSPGTAAIPRSAAVPEAAAPKVVGKRSDRELAVRSVAVATAGGVVAGAATIAVAAVAKNMAKPTPGLARRRKKDILQSQSFLIDVHVLKGNR